MPSAPIGNGGSRGFETPRYEPSAPRFQPPDAPRNQPYAAPRYEQPRETSRYAPPDNYGRVYDGGRRTSDVPSAARGPASGRSAGSGMPESGRSDPRSADNGSVPRDSGASAPRSTDGSWNNLSFDRVPPRTPIPTVSGSSRGPGSARLGLSGRGTGERSTTEGEGLVRIPHAEVTRESILQRYHSPSATSADGRSRSDAGNGPDLSRARNFGAAPETTSRGNASSSSSVPPRGSLEATRREREATDSFDKMRASHPERARAFDAAGAAVAQTGNIAARLSIGATLSFSTGSCGNCFWQPTCNTNQGSWWWNGCNGWPVWCSSSCGFCWPFGWGFSWWGNGWGCSYNTCCYSPWSYGYCSPYWGYGYYPSYAYCSPAPAYYSTVVYQGYDGNGYDNGYAGEYQQPQEKAGEGSIAVDHAAQGRVQQSIVQYLDLGDEAFSQGRYSDAVHYYARAVEASPENGRLYLILSDALFATGDYHYAAFALRRALELDGTLLAPAVDKHTFYGDPNEFDRQIAVAEGYLDEHFLDDDARLVLAANYLFANRPAQSSDLLLSAFSKTVRESSAGALLMQRAEELRKQRPLSK